MAVGNSVKDTLSGQASLLSDLTAQALEPELLRLDMTFSTFELLASVKTSGKRATQADIARRLGITPPSLTEAVRLATKAGLIDQKPSERDGRAKTLALTEAGGRKLQEILKAVNQTEKILVDGIDPVDLDVALGVLKVACRNVARELTGSN